MPSLPPHRWFQFRLTTVFVLVAILAWSMLIQPWVVPNPNYPQQLWPTGARIPPGYKVSALPGEPARVYINARTGTPQVLLIPSDRQMNPALRHPISVLTLFLAWKAARPAARSARRLVAWLVGDDAYVSDQR